MTKVFAFLRAINVGGHTVTMATLRQEFEAIRLDAVETFIASGNVIFESRAKDLAALEKTIERRLLKSLGYEVRTFLRTADQLAIAARHEPFTSAQMRTARQVCIGFIAEPLAKDLAKSVVGLKTDVDDFHVNGREVYWLCKMGQSDSTFSNARFEKLIKAGATWRNRTTVSKLAAKYNL
jgi:uncharacterized protein (DUF1697 family)